MKRIYTAILASALGLGLLGTAQADEFERCSIAPVDQVGYIDTFKTPQDCVAACKATEGCDSWSFRPHSFDPSKPGGCKLIKGIFKQEASERVFCGKL